MAEDSHNENSEEKKKANTDSQDDDDFGLPDLEFEELDELDLDMDDEDDPQPDADDDFSIDVGAESPETPLSEDTSESALEEGIDEVEDVLDSAQLISDRLGDGDEEAEQDFSSDINYDDLLTESPEEDVDEQVSADEELAALEAIDINTEDDTLDQESSDELSDINSPDELAALGIADEEDDTGIEKSESLFAADPDITQEDSDPDAYGDEEYEGGSIFASDEPLVKEEIKDEFQSADEASLPPTYKPYTNEESKGGFAKIIIFGALGFAIVGLIFWLISTGGIGEPEGKKASHVAKVEKPKAKKSEAKKKEEAEKAEKSENKKPETSGQKTENTAPKPANKPKTSDSNVRKPADTSSKPKVAKPKPQPANTAPAGEIVEVQDRTGRFHIIIGSFIDQDLANDYANELSKAGNGVKIIFPYGNSKRYRVSIADFDSGSSASNQIGNYRSTYGDDVWTLKY